MSFGSGHIWMNGSFVKWEDAKIHIASHVVHYGSGVFEGARCYDTAKGPACFRLDAHLRRLVESAKIYRMDSPFTIEELRQAVLETIRTNGYRACYIRPLVYRGYDSLGISPFSCPIDVAILLWEWGAYLGADSLEKGVDVCISSWARSAPNTVPALAKSTANYASAQLIKMEASVDGYMEGLALDPSGYVSEGSGQNVFVVRDNVIYTPPFSASILPGITRDSVITLARAVGYDVREELLPRELLYIADEVFFVGTAVEITPVVSVDKITVGDGKPGPVTKKIQREFFNVINGTVPDTHGWLTYVYIHEPSRHQPTSAKTK